jgi:hypothetical protein
MRNEDYMRGAEMLPEEVGGHVGLTICEKSPAKAAGPMSADKRQEVEAFLHRV